ncbi:MAG: hypothetical protein KA792_07760, partial [Bacteroidales bacterium]|nr:hypothetical protein [Bacteroidales bacterium]
MKKLLLVITIAVFSCIFAKGQGITVKLSTLTAKLNDTITCSVNVDNFNNIIAFGVDFTYNNSVLTFLKFTNFAMGGMNYNNVSEQTLNRILIGWNTLDVNGISLGNTKIIDVQFIYKGGETDLLINTANTMFMDKNTDILSYNYSKWEGL